MTAILDLAVKRRQFGITVLGMPLGIDNGREPLADATEASLDLVCYLMQERARAGQWVPAYPNDVWQSLIEGGFDWMRSQAVATEIFQAYALLDSLVRRAVSSDIAIVAQPKPEQV